MAKKKAKVPMKSKATVARELSERAAELADVRGRNLVEMGLICLQMQKDPELPRLAGAANYDAWLTGCFGKKKKLAYRCSRIVENLLGALSEEELLAMGQVKAYELSRLPESQRRKTEWIDAAKGEDTTTFKVRVKNFLEQAPDHREKFVTISFKAPESFRDVYRRVLGKGLLAESLGEPWMLWEAVLVDYELGLNLSPEEQEAAETVGAEVAQ